MVIVKIQSEIYIRIEDHKILEEFIMSESIRNVEDIFSNLKHDGKIFLAEITGCSKMKKDEID